MQPTTVLLLLWQDVVIFICLQSPAKYVWRLTPKATTAAAIRSVVGN